MIEKSAIPTSDESLMAAISHFLGFLVALVVWVTQKDKSRYVRFQSLQAMAFDVVSSAIVLILIGCMLTLSFGLVALGLGDVAILGRQANPTIGPLELFFTLMTALPFIIPCIAIPLAVLIFIARLIATIETFQGKEFRYPWLGNFIHRYLEQRPS